MMSALKWFNHQQSIFNHCRK